MKRKLGTLGLWATVLLALVATAAGLGVLHLFTGTVHVAPAALSVSPSTVTINTSVGLTEWINLTVSSTVDRSIAQVLSVTIAGALGPTDVQVKVNGQALGMGTVTGGVSGSLGTQTFASHSSTVYGLQLTFYKAGDFTVTLDAS